MKRTPMKRKTPLARVGKKKLAQGSPRWNGAMGPSVKPRKRLKSNRKAESKEHAAYRYFWTEDELRSIFAENGIEVPKAASCIHHIQWGHSRRKDAWTNMISLSSESHDWIHKHPADGRIVCLYAKLIKKELDWSVLDELYRGNNPREVSYRDYISTLKPQFDFAERFRQQLIKGESK